jgi:hypothetical protein
VVVEVENYARPFREQVVLSKNPAGNVPVRVAVIFLVALAVGAMGGWYRTEQALTAARATSLATTLPAIASLVGDNAALFASLQSAAYSEPDRGVLAAYLTKIRRDGAAKHIDMKQRLDTIDANHVKALALLEVYVSHVKTRALFDETKKFETFAITWHDRWASVFDTFMAGGNLPAVDPVPPSGLSEALRAELLATQ